MNLKINSDFPGGNITIERIQDSIVDMRPDFKNSSRFWFYWYFAVENAQGQTVKFNFGKNPCIGVHGPAVSYDQGVTWQWLGADAVGENDFEYRFADNETEVRFSFGMPYVLANWQRFIADYQDHANLKLSTLCQTKSGRDVPALHIENQNENPKHKVIITARHHACEMMSSYSIEGIIQWVANNASADAKWLRDHASLWIIPIVDLDGVEAGDQGKDRKPHDHNRDYHGTSIYPEVTAIREQAKQFKPTVGLDIHGPHIRGNYNEWVYVVGEEDPKMTAQQEQFIQCLKKNASVGLPITDKAFLEYGQAWNQPQENGVSFNRYFAVDPNFKMISTIELPYANASGVTVDQTSAHTFGKQTAIALSQYFQAIK